MNKKELLENYTMEQLADMVVGLNNESKKLFSEIHELKSQLCRKETIINQIDDILKDLFGVTHDIAEKPDEFKEILKEKIENSKTIADFLPTEPIKVADMLISAEGEATCSSNVEEMPDFFKLPYKLFNISKLRQIAEHLLVYCNANEGEET